jgi:hypothetical protein
MLNEMETSTVKVATSGILILFRAQKIDEERWKQAERSTTPI